MIHAVRINKRAKYMGFRENLKIPVLTKLEALSGTTGSTVVPALYMAKIAIDAITMPVIARIKVTIRCPVKVKSPKYRYLLISHTRLK